MTAHPARLLMEPSADPSSLAMRTRKRASKPKVRTGCLTCKQRRVKCDETHPSCGRCIKAGLHCQGYAVKKLPPNRAAARLLAPRTETVGSNSAIVAAPCSVPTDPWRIAISDERFRSFIYFKCRTAAQMSNLFEARSFWQDQVLRMCQTEPSICDAAIALGMLHEMHAANPSLRAPRDDPSNQTALLVLGQYNRAIEGVNRRLASSPARATEIALVSCLLFLGIDILLARFDAATRHVQNGLRIIQEWKPANIAQYNSQDPLLLHVRDLASSFDTDEEELAAQFVRLNFNINFHGVENRSHAIDLPFPDPFVNLVQARVHLSMVGEMIVRLARMVDGNEDALNPSVELRERQTMIANRLDEWKGILDKSVKTSLVPYLRNERNTLLTMHTHYLGMNVMIGTMLNGAREMTLDEHEWKFRDIVKIVREILETSSPDPLPTLCYDVGIIYPLFAVAMKCRNPFIRRQAIYLLEKHPRREGTMDSYSAARFSRKIVEMEELGFEGLTEARELPEYARFHQTVMVPPNDEGTGGFILCKRRRHETNEWVIIREPFEIFPQDDSSQGSSSP